MNITLIAPLIILTLGLIWDLKEKRVPNKLILIALPVSLIGIFTLNGFSGLGDAFLSAGLAFLLLIPLFALKILGGGDLKLFTVASLWIPSGYVYNSFLHSLIWGACLGVVYAIVTGRLKNVLFKTWSTFVTRTRLAENQTLNIPYTLAMILGFLSSGVGL